MSQKSTYPIRCPQCGEEQDVELFDSLNIQSEPDLRDRLMANQLNVVLCASCNASFRVDKPLLYNDPERHFMVNLIPVGETSLEEAQRQFSSWITEMNATLPEGMEAPVVHLVFSRVELVERIFMLEAGLHERIIEYIKYIIYSRNPERLAPLTHALLFDAEDSTDESLCFVVQDVRSQRLEELFEYSRQAYQGLCEMFDQDEQTPSLMELFPGPYVSARALFVMDAKVEGP